MPSGRVPCFAGLLLAAFACTVSSTPPPDPGSSGSPPSSGEGGSPAGNDGASAHPVDDASCASDAYPAGPYGTSVGAVLPDVGFVGHVNFGSGASLVSTYPFGPFSLDDLRRTCKPYALVHVVRGMWCGPCRLSAGELAQAWSGVQEKGGALIEIVNEGPTAGVAPTRADLDAWISSSSLAFTTVMDPPDHPLRSEQTLGGDIAFVVDLSTMKILHVTQGDVSAAISYLKQKLGP